MTTEQDGLWYAVQIKRNAFRVAEINLRRQNFGVFAPKITRQVSRFGKRPSEDALLFPGYAFVRDQSEPMRWRSLISTVGVSYVVMRSPGTPAEVPPGLIAGLQARCDDDGRLAPPKDLVTGSVVEVVSGPFGGLITSVEHIDEQQRVWILLEILGATRTVAVERKQLREKPTG